MPNLYYYHFIRKSVFLYDIQRIPSQIKSRLFKAVPLEIKQYFTINFIKMKKTTKSIVRQTKALYSSQLNRSSSKMLFSFSKSSRFFQSKPDCRSHYKMPSSISKRSASFGFASKNYISSSSLSIPGPNHYNLSQNTESRAKGITFGSSRQKTINNSFLNTSSKFNPSPADYHPKDCGQKTLKYSIGKKNLIPDHKRDYPGPSHYKTLDLVNSNGKAYLSNIRNSKGLKFSRFPRMQNPEKSVPGPGQYDVNKSMKSLSKHSRTENCKFACERKSKGGIYQINKVPGPGFYNHYTQFQSREF